MWNTCFDLESRQRGGLIDVIYNITSFYNPSQKLQPRMDESLGTKFALLAVLQTHQTNSHANTTSPTKPLPPPHVQCLKSRPATGHFRAAFCVPKRVFVEKHPYETVFHTTGSLWYKLNIFLCERFCPTAKTRFETEAQGTSEIAYLSRFSTFY